MPSFRARQPAGRSRPPSPTDAGTAGDPLRLWGQHAVAAALANPMRPCHRLLGTENALARLAPGAIRADLAVETRRPGELDRLVPPDAVHQGLVLEVGPLPELDIASTLADAPAEARVLVLDQIEDPRNLGAILRSAAGLGVAAVLLPPRGGAPLTGVCAKAASGALDMLPIIEAGNLARAMETLKGLGFWIIGLEAAAPPLETAPRFARTALVLGAEGRGLRPLTRERCDLLAGLAIEPRIASLNVSVAAGIALYLLARRPPEPGALSGRVPEDRVRPAPA